MPKFLANVDLGNNQLLNVVVQVLASAPSSPAAGRLYYDSTLTRIRYYNGTTWVDLIAAPTDASTLQGQNGAYYLDRSNHTGTQTASTISDLATVVQAYRLDQFAAPTSDVSLNSHKITNLTDPTNPQDAATKAYVDANSQGLDIKLSVRVATTANISLSGTQTIDGVAVIAGDRVLVKNQSTAADNGIYVVAAGAWSRATDAATSAQITPGTFTFVEEGTTNADTGWVLTTDAPITLGSTDLAFSQFSGAGQLTAGTGITKTGNTIAIDTANGYGVRKYSVDVGDNSSTAIVITHSLGTRDVDVTVYTNGSPYDTVWPDIERTSTSTVTLRFATAPTSAQYRAVVIG